MKHYKTILLILAGLFSQHVYAEEEPEPGSIDAMFGLPDYTTIATGTSKPLHLAPAVATVIKADEIKKMGATTLDEVLERVPGLHLTLNSVNLLNSFYSIRGIHTGQNQQVLLTVNGIPIQNLFNSARPNAYRLPVANIGRIEIIRGPGSAVHGADAFAGVINVVTKEAGDINGVNVGGRYGSFESKDSWLQYGGTWNDWNIVLSVEHSVSDGDQGRRVNNDLASLLDGMFANSSSLVKRYPLQTRYNILNSHASLSNANWTYALSSWQQRDGGLGAGAAQAIDPVGNTKVVTYQADIQYHPSEKLAGWKTDFRLNYQYEHDKNRFMLLPPGSLAIIGEDGNLFSSPQNANCSPGCVASFPNGIFGNPDAINKTVRFDINATSNQIKDHLIRVNVGAIQQDVEAFETKNFGPGTPAALVGDIAGPWVFSDVLTSVTGTPSIFMEHKTRRSWHVALQDEWDFIRDWTLTGGARYDKYSDFGSTFNPRLALVWNMTYDLTSKLLYGSAFRAPSFDEMYSKNNPVALGNKQIAPEKIKTIELAIDYRPEQKNKHTFNTYYYQARDLTGYVAVAAGKQSQNVLDQNGYGFEWESTWEISRKLQLRSAFAWQHTQNQKDDSTIPNAPSRQLKASVTWKPVDSWSVYGSANWVMDRARAKDDARTKIGDYTFVNLAVRKQWANNFEAAFLVRNLFDEDGREPSDINDLKIAPISEDYPLAGRSIAAELRYHLGK